MEKIKIEINEMFEIFISHKDDYGAFDKKAICLDDLYNILSECNNKRQYKKVKKESNMLYSSPLMPNFNGVHVLQHIIKNNTTQIVVLQREAKRSKIAFYDEVLEDVGMPSLLFMVYIINNKISSARVVAVKDKVIREDSMLYKYPLTNVYGDGAICFGGNDLKKYELDNTFNNLHSFPNMFLMMPSTHELQHQNGYNMQLRPLLNYLKGKDFDVDKLVEAKISYKEWINRNVR